MQKYHYIAILYTTLLIGGLARAHSVSAMDIIAHRGASGFLPEHTTEALVLSFMQGANYIEQDLVATKDHQLIVLHDIHLETVTNVEDVFPQRARENGRFYAIDFTLAELRTLSVHERENADNTPVFKNRYRGRAHFTVATFEEHVELINELNRGFNKQVGVYPELKAPSWHVSQGVDIVALFMQKINTLDLNTSTAKIFVQSFEPDALKRIRKEFKSEVKLVQLIAENDWAESDTDYNMLRTEQGIAEIATYAQGIGPYIPQIYRFTDNTPTGLIKMAHKYGLIVHPYTFRTDAIALGLTPEEAFTILQNLGIDGLFTDQIMPYMLDQ